MNFNSRLGVLLLLGLSIFIMGSRPAECAEPKSRRNFGDNVLHSPVRPHWLPGTDEFWYSVKSSAQTMKYVRVNTDTGEKTSGPDLASIKLPALAELRTSSMSPKRVDRSRTTGEACVLTFVNELDKPVELYWLNPDGAKVKYAVVESGKTHQQNTYEGHVWQATDGAGKQIAILSADAAWPRIVIDGIASKTREETGRVARRTSSNGTSPDGKWRVQTNGRTLELTRLDTKETVQVAPEIDQDATFFGSPSWSPKSDAFVISATIPVSPRRVTVVESTPTDQKQPKLKTFDYVKPGDPLPQPIPVLIRLVDGAFQPVAVGQSLFPNQYADNPSHNYRWAEDGSEFYFDYNARGHQTYRILAVNSRNGEVRAVVEETSPTFIDYTKKTWRHWLTAQQEILWLSERSGWCHLWKFDVTGVRPAQPLTSGNWVVRSVEYIDEASATIWFLASGLRVGEDPYHVHLCKVQLDGSKFLQLTDQDGTHEIEFAPDHRFFVDTCSRVDQAPIVELRQSSDGRLVCELERSDSADVVKTGWPLPERFTAKGRDGETDIYGVIVKPSQFDPAKTYPVVENVYAGPHAAFAPLKFGSHLQLQAIADLGFVVVQADGMGTNFRGKTFHDVCWKNLKDAGFSDRIAWIKAAAKTRPWMDLSRVGLYGGSAGGQTAMRALLDHSDFYQVAVADCGCHDNRMDKIWWNEQWMGWPVDDSYARSSNVDDAAKLVGHLLLIVGELDQNVDPASTMQVVGALQKAGKSFDFAPIIGAGHGAAETPFGSRLRRDFLVRHLKP